MRNVIGLLGATLLLSGCLFHKSAPSPAPPVRVQQPQQPQPVQQSKPVIKPDLHTSGQVTMVNAAARFVVISFPPGPLPQTGDHLNVYRNGLKVGEIKVTGPQRDNNTVADISAGEAQPHDEVRAE